jgi:hypothetical protein
MQSFYLNYAYNGFARIANFHNVPLSVPTNQALTQRAHACARLSTVPVWLTLPDGKSKLTGKPENLLCKPQNLLCGSSKFLGLV